MLGAILTSCLCFLLSERLKTFNCYVGDNIIRQPNLSVTTTKRERISAIQVWNQKSSESITTHKQLENLELGRFNKGAFKGTFGNMTVHNTILNSSRMLLCTTISSVLFYLSKEMVTSTNIYHFSFVCQQLMKIAWTSNNHLISIF